MGMSLRACDVLNRALPDGVTPLTDDEIFVACDTCGDLSLSSLFLALKEQSVYTCPCILKPLVIVAASSPDDAFWMKGVYRFGEFAIWHAGDLRFRSTVIPRSTRALREIRTRITKQRRQHRVGLAR